METYTILREIADSWVLLAMTLFYLSACLWAFRPSQAAAVAEAAAIPFRPDPMETTPMEAPEAEFRTPDCTGDCETCPCRELFEEDAA